LAGEEEEENMKTGMSYSQINMDLSFIKAIHPPLHLFPNSQLPHPNPTPPNI
jgi:hypothetical protein